MISIRNLYRDYFHSAWFAVGLVICVITSHALAHLIPLEVFNNIITPYMNLSIGMVCLFGALLMFLHSGGLRIRKVWGITLFSWGVAEIVLVISAAFTRPEVLLTSSGPITLYELIVGNALGYLLVLYPTELLRPGWLNVKRGLMQYLPVLFLGIVSYVSSLDLRPIITLYPLFLVIILLWHLRAYRRWCEENYSSMEDIDVQWVSRFLFMLSVAGLSFAYLCIGTHPTRVFTQQWLMLFVFIYSTEQILFRRDPWQIIRGDKAQEEENQEAPSAEYNAAYKETLEQWMETEKPYLNPEFRLIDIRTVIPVNRTYLSQLIGKEYGCSFYQYVARYRIAEAKRLMQEHPEMKMQEVAENSGFSSPSAFSRTFTNETGISPTEWAKNLYNS